MNMSEAYVTLVTTDSYGIGALVLANSLLRFNTQKQLVVMITADSVSDDMQQLLREKFHHVELVELLDSNDEESLALLGRPDLGVTFTKLHCWKLVQYTKAVFMDADTLVLQDIDDLFEREELSAAPDIGWPDCFNSGVFVFRPSLQTYHELLAFAVTAGSTFDGGDQGLLNNFFSDWATKDIARHLPFIYNCVYQTFYTYLPSLRRFAASVKVIHFIGMDKPWFADIDTSTGHVISSSAISGEFLQMWWDVFLRDVFPRLSIHTDFYVNNNALPHNLIHLLKLLSKDRNFFRMLSALVTLHDLAWPPSSDTQGTSSHTTSQHMSSPSWRYRQMLHDRHTHKPIFKHVIDYSFLECSYHARNAATVMGHQEDVGKGIGVRLLKDTEDIPVVRYLITIDENVEESDEGKICYLSPTEWIQALIGEELLQGSSEVEELRKYLTDVAGISQIGLQNGIAGRLAKITLSPGAEFGKGSNAFTPLAHGSSSMSDGDSHIAEGGREAQYRWERGEIDYLGIDRFDKILNKLYDGMFKDNK